MTSVTEFPRIKGFCEDCKHSEKIRHTNSIRQGTLHCRQWRGDDTKNVWIKYKKEYRDFSLVFPDEYCSSFE